MNLANSTMCPIVDFGQRSWTFVRLLFSQLCRLIMPFGVRSVRRSHSIGIFLVRMKPPVTLVESILVESNSGNDFHPQEHPIFGKILRLYCFQSFDY